MSLVRTYDKEEYGYRKAAVTRALKPINRKLAILKDVETVRNKKEGRELDEMVDKLKMAIRQYEECLAGHEKWIEKNHTSAVRQGKVLDQKYVDAFKEFEKDFQEYQANAFEAFDSCDALLQDYYDEESPVDQKKKNDPVAAIGASFNDPGVPTKMSTLLAPKPLEHSASKSQYLIFKEKFIAHYGINNVHRLEFSAQKAFLFQSLDDQLIQRIQVQFSRHVEYSIFETSDGTKSIFGFLDELFDSSDPLLVRRNAYLSCRQGKHEKNLEYFNRLQKCELDAECSQIQPREIFISLLMIGLTDERLKKEISKLGHDPDLDEVKRLFVEDENLKTLSGVTNPHVNEMSDFELPHVSQLSNYRRNVNLRLQGPSRGSRQSYPGRGGSHSNRGNRQPQHPNQSRQFSQVRSSACQIKTDGKVCNFSPFWNCFNHSRIPQAQRKEMDKSFKPTQANQMSVFQVASSDDPVWQDQTVPYTSETNMMGDAEILEIPVAIQTLSNGRELPLNFWHPTDPQSCPRIYCKVAPAIDGGQPLGWVNVCTLPDTGCQHPVINSKIVHDNGWPIKPLSQDIGLQDVLGASGHSLGCIGKVLLMVEYFGHTVFESDPKR